MGTFARRVLAGALGIDGQECPSYLPEITALRPWIKRPLQHEAPPSATLFPKA